MIGKNFYLSNSNAANKGVYFYFIPTNVFILMFKSYPVGPEFKTDKTMKEMIGFSCSKSPINVNSSITD